jgi:hypothetical protein
MASTDRVENITPLNTLNFYFPSNADIKAAPQTAYHLMDHQKETRYALLGV